jgi:hypothetical protein
VKALKLIERVEELKKKERNAKQRSKELMIAHQVAAARQMAQAKEIAMRRIPAEQLTGPDMLVRQRQEQRHASRNV